MYVVYFYEAYRFCICASVNCCVTSIVFFSCIRANETCIKRMINCPGMRGTLLKLKAVSRDPGQIHPGTVECPGMAAMYSADYT